MRTFCTAAVAAALALAAPAEGQEREINRSVFTFGKTTLTIDVSVETPGSLRVLRGRRGEIRATARAADGFADFGLVDRRGNTLQLTAIGSDRVDFIVVVPENVRVRVRLPDRDLSEVFATTQPVATYSWDPTPLPGTVPPASGIRPGSVTSAGPATVRGADGLDIAYAGPQAPRTLLVGEETPLRRLTVRWEGDRFEVATSRPLATHAGSAETMEIRAPGDALDIVVTVPAGVREFALQVGASDALVIRGGNASVLCTPVIDQQLGAASRSFTFTPTDGRLDCQTRLPPGIRRS
jgi:hypothetical protein